MPSIKCNQCGLINFVTAEQCKRCAQPFNEFAPIASKRSYQSNFQSFQTPPLPPRFDGNASSEDKMKFYCLKCGNHRNTQIQNFKKEYVSPVASLGIFIGFLPYLILKLLLTTKHQITAPFCGECWAKFQKVSKINQLCHLGFVVALLLGIGTSVLLKAPILFLPIFVVSIALLIYARINEKKNSPNYKKIDSKQVIVNAPVVGDVCFTK